MNFFNFSRFRPSAGRPQVQADYLHVLTGRDEVIIFDQNLGRRSVTNDIAAVLADIAHAEGLESLAGQRVTYRDARGEWSRVLLGERGLFVQFYSFGKRVTDEGEAVRLLRLMPF